MASKKKVKKAKKPSKGVKKHSKVSKKSKTKNKASKVSKKSKKQAKYAKHKARTAKPKKHAKPKPAVRHKKPRSAPRASIKAPVPKSPAPGRRQAEPPEPPALTKHGAVPGPDGARPAAPASIEHYVNDIVRKIKNVEIQGGNDIAEASVRTLKYVAEKSPATNRKAFMEELKTAAEKLKEARPTEPALRNAINAIVESTDRYELKSMDNVRRYAVRQADRFLKELAEVVEIISRVGAEEIRDGDVVVTHCHSEHVVAILKKAKEKRKQFRVIVTETRPLNQGLMTARELSESGIDVTYIIDAAAATVMKQATKMLVGADAILADGSIVNKIGTYAMALLAKQFQTPVFVAAETLKFDPVTVMGAAEPIEQRMPDEIVDPQEIKKARILNPAYDVTPAELIDALITEKGIMRPGLIRECSA